MSRLILQGLPVAPAGGVRPSGATALQWYKLDEAASPAANSGTAGGSSLVGYGGTTWGQPLSTLTWASQSVQINSKDTDYVSGASNIDPLYGAGALTIEFWTYLTGGLDFAFGANPYMATRGSQWALFWGSGNTVWSRLQIDLTSFPYYEQSNISIFSIDYVSSVQNKICYWVFTRPTINDWMVCYLNGVNVGYLSHSGYPNGPVWPYPGAATSIGPSPTGTYAKSIAGQYSNFIISNTYTPVATALARYNAAFP